MKVDELYKELTDLRLEVDNRLRKPGFDQIKDMILWLAKSKSFQKLKFRENQMKMLDIFCSIWLDEKRKLPQLGIDDDIFSGIYSLKDIENKYRKIQFGLIRLENLMPEKYYEQVIDDIIEYKVSGIALRKILIKETLKCEENALTLSRLLKKRGQIIVAMIFLEAVAEDYPENTEMIFELADCWLAGGQWVRAMECLQKIRKPDSYIEGLMKELEKKISDEIL